MMKKIAYLLSLFMGFSSYAQDAHFSQPYFQPLYLNPAMTGFFDGHARVGFTFRDQWFTANSPYGKSQFQTIGGFVDVSLLKEKLKGDFLGIGAYCHYDKAGDFGLSTTYASFNLAYSKQFGVNVKHAIALGLQGEFFYRSIGKGTAVFSDGITENLGKSTMSFDAGLGVRYHVVLRKRLNLYAGFAYLHLIGANQSLISKNDKLKPKYVGSFGAEIEGTEKVNFVPSIVASYQSVSLDILPGIMANFLFGNSYEKQNYIGIGCNFRFSRPVPDAVIPAVKLYYKNINLGVAYDINISEFKKATKSVGAIEVGLIYTFKIGFNKRENTNCPKL